MGRADERRGVVLRIDSSCAIRCWSPDRNSARAIGSSVRWLEYVNTMLSQSLEESCSRSTKRRRSTVKPSSLVIAISSSLWQASTIGLWVTWR